MAQRIDRGNLAPAKRLADGRVRVDAYITRTGVFSYALPDGTIRREYRPADEVFRADSLATFSMVPVTDDHPPVMLNAENATQYSVGVTGEQPRRDGNFVQLPLMVMSSKTIKKMDAGKIQVSAGYECDCEEVPGISPDGERYDAVQRNIRANHVAIVMHGRAGAAAAVRMDGAGIQLESAPAHGARADEESTEESDMELKEALEQAAKATARADAADAKALALTTELERLKGERDALQGAATKAEKERKDAIDSLEPRVRARVALEHRAAGILKGTDLTKLSDRAIKTAVIKHLDSVEVAAEASDAYVDGRFDASVERLVAASDALANTLVEGEKARLDSVPVDPEVAARQEMLERHRNASKIQEGKN